MSFEGCYQVLCKNGHLDVVDVYIFDEFSWECGACKTKEVAWMNTVDQTNGSYDDEGNRIDGWIELKPVSGEKVGLCDKCGSTYLTEHTQYEIPEKY